MRPQCIDCIQSARQYQSAAAICYSDSVVCVVYTVYKIDRTGLALVNGHNLLHFRDIMVGRPTN